MFTDLPIAQARQIRRGGTSRRAKMELVDLKKGLEGKLGTGDWRKAGPGVRGDFRVPHTCLRFAIVAFLAIRAF